MTNKSILAAKKPHKPSQVQEVHTALIANAKEAGLPRDATLCLFMTYKDGSEWVVGSNREDGTSSMVYRDAKWFYREPIEGSDKPINGGFAEAKANCRCFFTG